MAVAAVWPGGLPRPPGRTPPVQEAAGDLIQAIAVPHQGQGRLPGIAPGQEKAEVRRGFRQKDQIWCDGNLQN